MEEEDEGEEGRGRRRTNDEWEAGKGGAGVYRTGPSHTAGWTIQISLVLQTQHLKTCHTQHSILKIQDF